MSIVRRKDSAGRTYYINTTTGKRTSETSWHRSAKTKTAKSNKSKASSPACSKRGYDFKVFGGSANAKKLRKCGA